MSRLLITGASPRPPPGTNNPPRLEIRALVADTRQFSLYIQALQRIYARTTADRASYFQISGIHGRPFVDWNGAPSQGRGYCVHRTEVFPTWHRPYVVLFEQEVQRVAREIAETYQTADRPSWQAAAANLRQPYWGWDALSTFIPPPEVIRLQNVPITGPDGRTVNTPNPFFNYAFPAGTTTDFPAPYNTTPRTVRHPLNGVSQPDALVSDLNAVAQQTVDNTRRLFSLPTWRAFTLGSGSTSGLESIHDTIHVRSGGVGGHMRSVPVAAFDPIFWLHHAQVDRVIDLWVARQQVWTTDTQNLSPFWNTQTTFWQSRNIRDTRISFNYGYMDSNRLLAESKAVLEQTSSEVSAESTAGNNPSDPSLQQLFTYPLPAMSTEAVVNPGETLPESGGSLLEWSARVCCKQFEIGGSFSIFVFIGDVPADSAKWITDPAFAGTFDVFANDTPDECANCNEQRNLVVCGFVHLNRSILKRSGQRSLEKNVVVPYLKDNLNWGIQKADGSIGRVDEIPSLDVTIECTPLTLPVGAEYPTEGEPQYYHEITMGRPGGHHDSDD